MSFNNFISFLQQILTMVDENDRCSIALATSILSSTIALAEASGKVDPITRRTMRMAENSFYDLVSHSKEFAGEPGDYKGNEQKRRKLGLMLKPGC